MSSVSDHRLQYFNTSLVSTFIGELRAHSYELWSLKSDPFLGCFSESIWQASRKRIITSPLTALTLLSPNYSPEMAKWLHSLEMAKGGNISDRAAKQSIAAATCVHPAATFTAKGVTVGEVKERLNNGVLPTLNLWCGQVLRKKIITYAKDMKSSFYRHFNVCAIYGIYIESCHCILVQLYLLQTLYLAYSLPI